MPLRPQTQRLQSLKQKKRGKGIHRGPKVAQDVQTDLDRQDGLAKGLDEAHAVVSLRGLREVRELAGRRPVELTAVDDDAAEDGAVPADPFCCAVGDDVCAVLDGADKVT